MKNEHIYTHKDADGILWRFENGRPVSNIADEVMSEVFPLFGISSQPVMNCEKLPVRKIYRKKFPKLETSIFSMRNKRGLPRFALYLFGNGSIKEACITISIYDYDNSQMSVFVSDNYPGHEIRDQLYKVIFPNLKRGPNDHHHHLIKKEKIDEKWLRFLRRGFEETQLISTFNGILPVGIKEKIPHFASVYDDIGIISEVKKWNVKTHITKDPLLVGIIFNPFEMRVLAHFECTKMEDYIRKELAV